MALLSAQAEKPAYSALASALCLRLCLYPWVLLVRTALVQQRFPTRVVSLVLWIQAFVRPALFPSALREQARFSVPPQTAEICVRLPLAATVLASRLCLQLRVLPRILHPVSSRSASALCLRLCLYPWALLVRTALAQRRFPAWVISLVLWIQAFVRPAFFPAALREQARFSVPPQTAEICALLPWAALELASRLLSPERQAFCPQVQAR